MPIEQIEGLPDAVVGSRPSGRSPRTTTSVSTRSSVRAPRTEIRSSTSSRAAPGHTAGALWEDEARRDQPALVERIAVVTDRAIRTLVKGAAWSLPGEALERRARGASTGPARPRRDMTRQHRRRSARQRAASERSMADTPTDVLVAATRTSTTQRGLRRAREARRGQEGRDGGRDPDHACRGRHGERGSRRPTTAAARESSGAAASAFWSAWPRRRCSRPRPRARSPAVSSGSSSTSGSRPRCTTRSARTCRPGRPGSSRRSTTRSGSPSSRRCRARSRSRSCRRTRRA